MAIGNIKEAGATRPPYAEVFQFGNVKGYILTYNHTGGAGTDTIPTDLPAGVQAPSFSKVYGVWLTATSGTPGASGAKVHVTIDPTTWQLLTTVVTTTVATAIITVLILGL